MRRSEMRGKSSVTRKALGELPNNHSIDGREREGRFSKSASRKKKTMLEKETSKKPGVKVNEEEEEGEEDEFLDQLLLVQSDLSSLTRQVDKLVAQAFQQKAISKHGREEIESFRHFLSNVLSSFKPWVPRFEKALCGYSVEPENKLQRPLADNKTASDINEDGSFEADSPEQNKMCSIISPSPLVSWRAGCNKVERGRQLFLLTPLPISKTLLSKQHDLPKSVFERIASKPAVELPSFLTISGDGNENLFGGMATITAPIKPSDSIANEAKSTLESVSSPIVSKRDDSFLVTTPCLKMSPPKSCVLLEPIAQFSHKGNVRSRKSTPYPFGIHSHFSESSGSECSEDLALKYPELLGIQRAYESRMGNKELDASPNWSFSPLKTCVLLEPSEEKTLDIDAADHRLKVLGPVLNQQTNFTSSKECNFQGGCHQIKKPGNQAEPTGGRLALIESTPLGKEPESTIRTRKLPGETTLKKELWTKFEAATTCGIRLNGSAFQGSARKGFLDMLDEVSCDGES